MARNTTANWTQGNASPDHTTRTVFTNKNTDFETWKSMALAELTKRKIDVTTVRRLSVLHAWEGGNTPNNFAQEIEHRINKAKRRLM